jgi:hypothetical protein
MTLRATSSVDADGSPQLSWSTHLASIRARLKAVRPRQSFDAARLATRRRWTSYVDRDHDIVATDRIVYAAATLRITGINDPGTPGPIKAISAEELHA